MKAFVHGLRWAGWLAGLVILNGLTTPVAWAADEPGPLAAYVGRPDASFAWKVRREGKVDDAEFVELTLTSQTWRGIDWKHQLFILKPAKVRDTSRAALFIGGGRWNDQLAVPIKVEAGDLPREGRMVAALAAQAGTPVAVLLQVPFQPLFDGLVEDALISYTFAEYIKSQDPTWPLLLPMAKSAVRALDSIQAVAKERWQLDIEHFTVTGASKRGWTTWLTAAVDPRVDAFAPMVIDMLNMGPQMKNQLATWGRYSEQIHDYTDRGLPKFLATDRGQALMRIVDPFSYRAALKQPKLILLGTNDRYWPLDSLNMYWRDLLGDKYVLYVPNAGHSLQDFGRVVGTVSAFHRHASGELKLPKLVWQTEQTPGGLKLSVTSDLRPEHVSAWVAKAPTRDFRPAHWESTPLEGKQADENRYEYILPTPESGFAAVFAETSFTTDALPYYLSTNVSIVEAAKQPAEGRGQ